MKEIEKTIQSLSHQEALRWAVSCSENVLCYYHGTQLDDLKEILDSALLWLDGNLSVPEARQLAFKAHAIARDAPDAPSIKVARSVGHAAATVHVKDHAIHAATYALKAITDETQLIEEKRWQMNRAFKFI
ncbi:hypothetical protein G7062_04795 [Erysipelothrix sp. HDW6C]|uniref:putative immunity protein n=1 Tax=Erysipelothrix sp. HDW6C TaxID=2714930 RepID=UPI00140DA11A|nr:hypothetical protein [Erysipelothrix sp. HDW6C]QIK69655.1 hypothetical protein G7062_04795 [Erysipelothrix sp. HDW6C]